MRRTGHAHEEPGQESFLDVVANIVGILIILVMVVGVRAGHALRTRHAGDQPTPGLQEADAPNGWRAHAAALVADVHQLDQQTAHLKVEVLLRQDERQRWETLAMAAEQELARQRSTLDAVSRAEYDRKLLLRDLRTDLDRLGREQIALEGEKADVIPIVNRPTPISRTVRGREVHIQLRGGLVTIIPLDALVAQLESEAKQKLWKLNRQSEIVETLGPVGGFRLRYELQRYDSSLETQLETGRRDSMVRLTGWQLLPVSDQMGETAAEALAESSEFRHALSQENRRTATITLWTYPDSFAVLRSIKDELHARGFQVAVRPLPDGMPIGGSPRGTRSAAQ
jgi:hypothetical protein